MKYPLCLVIVVLFFGCNDSKERPSPLRQESTDFKNGSLSISFSSPAVTSVDGVDRKGEIWGGLVPYNQIWRTGANEATTFSTSQSIQIEGQPLDSGTYALFTIPGTDSWTLILNEDWNQWGTYQYDSTLNVIQLEIDPKTVNDYSERMKFYFEDEQLKFHWENLTFSLSLE